MAKVIYRGRYRDGLHLGHPEGPFAPWGEPVEVDDDLAAELLALPEPDQWESADPPTKPATKRTPKETD